MGDVGFRDEKIWTSRLKVGENREREPDNFF
jgi:hypothetical protein